jgi:hypothetical protein
MNVRSETLILQLPESVSAMKELMRGDVRDFKLSKIERVN